MSSGAEDASITRPHIEFLLLADRAEVKDQHLYMMGGVVNTATATKLPDSLNLSAALAVAVPWRDSTLTLPMEVQFRDPHGEVLARAGWTLVAGPTHLLQPGDIEYIPIAFSLGFIVSEPGLYSTVVLMHNLEEARTTFRVRLDPHAPAPFMG